MSDMQARPGHPTKAGWWMLQTGHKMLGWCITLGDLVHDACDQGCSGAAKIIWAQFETNIPACN